ncbi:hypothetical protein OTU49_007878, partial [Cherax quadricarinatus]
GGDDCYSDLRPTSNYLGVESSIPAVKMEKVEKLAVPCLPVGEGPHWQEDLQALLFVDVFAKKLRRHFINTGRSQELYLDDGDSATHVSMVIPVEDDPEMMVVALGKNLSVVHWSVDDPDIHTTKPKVLHTTTDHRFNDAKCDPQGRLWAGTMCPLDDKGKALEYNNSSLYKFDHDLVCTSWVKKVTSVCY